MKTRDVNQIYQLQDQGRETVLQWVATRKKDKGVIEIQRTYKPIIPNNMLPDDCVPSLMMLAAHKLQKYGEELPLTNLPKECMNYVQLLPSIIEINQRKNTQMVQSILPSRHTSTRVLPNWLLKTKGYGEHAQLTRIEE